MQMSQTDPMRDASYAGDLCESRDTKIARLEKENAELRWAIQEIRMLMARVPDDSLPRAAKVKQWGKQTVIELFTRTAPRVALIWGGAGFVVYIVSTLLK